MLCGELGEGGKLSAAADYRQAVDKQQLHPFRIRAIQQPQERGDRSLGVARAVSQADNRGVAR